MSKAKTCLKSCRLWKRRASRSWLIDRGRPDPRAGINSDGFKALLRSIDKGRTWVKVSGGYRLGPQAMEYARQLVRVAGADRLVWASDCPFVGHEGQFPYQATIDWLNECVSDAAARARRRLRARGADVFLGVSAPNIVTEADVASMAPGSVVFAMANPMPEIDPDIAARHAAVVATGRSDFANQINNVLVFPGVFRGLIDSGVSHVNIDVLLAAADALADVVLEDELNATYIIPSVFHPDVSNVVAEAVRAAVAAREQA